MGFSSTYTTVKEYGSCFYDLPADTIACGDLTSAPRSDAHLPLCGVLYTSCPIRKASKATLICRFAECCTPLVRSGKQAKQRSSAAPRQISLLAKQASKQASSYLFNNCLLHPGAKAFCVPSFFHNDFIAAKVFQGLLRHFCFPKFALEPEKPEPIDTFVNILRLAVDRSAGALRRK